EREARDARGVHRRPRRNAGGHRRVERRQLDPAVAVRGPHAGDVPPDAVQPDELVHPFTLDCCLALQFQAQFDEERDSSREILDHNAGVIHPVDRHATSASVITSTLPRAHPAGALRFWVSPVPRDRLPTVPTTSPITPELSRRTLEGTFPGELGIELVHIDDELVRGPLQVERRHLHPGGYVHGGVWVALADTVAAWGTMRHLRAGSDFTTVEVK